jgi:hypothetical protein
MKNQSILFKDDLNEMTEFENGPDLEEPINNDSTMCSYNKTLMNSMNDLTLKMNNIEVGEEEKEVHQLPTQHEKDATPKNEKKKRFDLREYLREMYFQSNNNNNASNMAKKNEKKN